MGSAREDRRWVDGGDADQRLRDEALSRTIARRYPQLERPLARLVYSSVHDVAEVVCRGDRYALKLYRPGLRSPEQLRYEVDLHRHLRQRGAPVVEPVPGIAGAVERLTLDGVDRDAILSRWAPGAKPGPSVETYRLVGRAAAVLHRAADDNFSPTFSKPAADFDSEVHAQVERLRPTLDAVGRASEVDRLADRLVRFLSARDLDRGVCHNDLTLDNVHVDGDEIHVFDLDLATIHWRAWEPQGVFQYSILSGGPWWDAWLAGYTEVRPFTEEDRRAVPWFVLMAHLGHTAWLLGLTPTSTGVQLSLEGLPPLVDRWTAWADTHCTPGS